MNDKLGFVPDSVKEAASATGEAAKKEVKKGLKETLSQIFGIQTSESKKQQESAKKIAEKAEKGGRTPEEQAKLESLRKQLHAQVTAPKPKSPEQPVDEQEDKVGTNEQAQGFGQPSPGRDQTSNLGEPSLPHSGRRVERLKIRE